jgi:hypothetical protein
MIRAQEILPFREPAFRPHPEANGRQVVHFCWRQEFPAWEPSVHLIPQPHDRDQLARLSTQPVLILERIAAVLDNDCRQRPMGIMAPDSEACAFWQDVDAVQDNLPQASKF